MATEAGAWPPTRIAREQSLLAGVLVVLALACWWITGLRMDGMAMGPTFDLGGLGFYTGVWVVMMAAMMFPSGWPIIGMYERIRAARPLARRGTPLVVAGDLATWTETGLLAIGLSRRSGARS